MEIWLSFPDSIPRSISAMLGRKQMEVVPLTHMQSIAKYLNQPEAAIRLLITLLSGYLLALVYRMLVKCRLPVLFRHMFLAVCGMGLCYFNYGMQIYHSLLTVMISHCVMHLLHESRFLVAVNFVFNMTYLLVGYYTTESGGYDILWTMPQCVLALRMIGLSFDLRDGKKSNDQLSSNQRKNLLTNVPTMLEVLGYAYFPASFLVGPQYAFRRYRRFISGKFPYDTSAIVAGITRLAVGLCYLGLQQLGTYYIPDEYILSSEFHQQSFLWRLVLLGLWGKAALYKYVACWLITEGALMCFGISYNGMIDDSTPNWHGCSNVRLWLLETGTTMQHYIQSFNVNTNLWVSQYIYKRLKFINNRAISFLCTLFFLALWHGFHSGYYVCFLIEYAVLVIEKQIEEIYKAVLLPNLRFLNYNICQKIIICLMKFYNVVCMGWCLLPFVFLTYDRWILASGNVQHCGVIFMLFWSTLYLAYNILLLKPKKKTAASDADSSAAAKNGNNDSVDSPDEVPTTTKINSTPTDDPTQNLRQRSVQT